MGEGTGDTVLGGIQCLSGRDGQEPQASRCLPLPYLMSDGFEKVLFQVRKGGTRGQYLSESLVDPWGDLTEVDRHEVMGEFVS